MVAGEARHTSEPVFAAVLAVRLAVVADADAKVRALGAVIVKLARVKLSAAIAEAGHVHAAAVLALHRTVRSAIFVVTTVGGLLEHLTDRAL
eukprot:scaffold56166_cov64-Phaeocystis_antarctica.AAC.8